MTDRGASLSRVTPREWQATAIILTIALAGLALCVIGYAAAIVMVLAGIL